MKTTTVILFLICCAASLARAQNSLTVSVKGIKAAKGNIRVGLFDHADKFLKTAVKGQVVKAVVGEITVKFDNVPDGTFAVSVIHDENENGQLDAGFMGIPKEGFGFSKNAMGTFGPPKFSDASIQLPQDKSIEVTLKYM